MCVCARPQCYQGGASNNGSSLHAFPKQYTNGCNKIYFLGENFFPRVHHPMPFSILNLLLNLITFPYIYIPSTRRRIYDPWSDAISKLVNRKRARIPRSHCDRVGKACKLHSSEASYTTTIHPPEQCSFSITIHSVDCATRNHKPTSIRNRTHAASSAWTVGHTNTQYTLYMEYTLGICHTFNRIETVNWYRFLLGAAFVICAVKCTYY